MTRRNAAELALGVAGIYFLAENFAASVLSLVTLLQNEHLEALSWIGSAQIALMLLFGGALLALRGKLAAWLSRDMGVEPAATTAPGVQAAAISVLGLCFYCRPCRGATEILSNRIHTPNSASSSRTCALSRGARFGPCLDSVPGRRETSRARRVRHPAVVARDRGAGDAARASTYSEHRRAHCRPARGPRSHRPLPQRRDARESTPDERINEQPARWRDRHESLHGRERLHRLPSTACTTSPRRRAARAKRRRSLHKLRLRFRH